METRIRSFAKAASWQLLGLVTMSILGFLFTGSLTSGGALAAASGLLGFFTYLVHERVWAGVRWGWTSATGMPREPLPPGTDVIAWTASANGSATIRR